jgi:hypothetical protein
MATLNAMMLNYSNRKNLRFKAFLEAGQRPRNRK